MLTKQKRLKLDVTETEFDLLNRFIDYLNDDILVLIKYNTDPSKFTFLKETLSDISNIKKGGNEFYALAIFAYLTGAFFDYLWYDYSFIFMFWFVVILNLIEKRNLEIKGFRNSGIEAPVK